MKEILSTLTADDWALVIAVAIGGVSLIVLKLLYGKEPIGDPDEFYMLSTSDRKRK